METIKDKTPSEQADEIVEMFAEIINLRDFDGPHWEKELDICSTDCAILHVTGIIEVLKRDNNIIVDGEYPYMVSVNQDAIDHHQSILSVLEGRVG